MCYDCQQITDEESMKKKRIFWTIIILSVIVIIGVIVALSQDAGVQDAMQRGVQDGMAN